MGTTWSSPHGASFTFEDIEVWRSGTFNGEADGYGTLIMPWGTVTDVLRVHWTNTMQDSLDAFVMDYVYDSYVLFVEGQFQPVAEVVTASIDFGGGPLTNQFARWSTELSTGIADGSTTARSVWAYPNPSTDPVQVSLIGSFDAPAYLTLSDMAGRKVLAQDWSSGDDRSTVLSVAGLEPGTYQLVVTSRTGSRTTTPIVVH